MFISKKHLSRRRLLQGAGAGIALPLLDAMIPAATAQQQASLKLVFIYLPHGAVYDNWTPTGSGSNFELSPILSPLQDFKSQLTIVSNLRNKPAEGPDPHAITAGTWLRCVPPGEYENPEAGISCDQVAARALGGETPFPSLELATNNTNAASYTATFSFRTPTQPLPMEADPRKLYFRMFGQGETAQERDAITSEKFSLLDQVLEDANSLNQQLGASDQIMMEEYLESIRAIELQMDKLASKDMSYINIPDAPVGIPNNFPAHMQLMYDLMALAYQADLSRVVSFMSDREVSMRTFNHVGVSDAFHPLSHHQNDPAKLERLSRVQQWYVSAFSDFVKKLSDMPDGDGSVLDHSILLFGSCMGDSNLHNNDKVPALLVGRGNGRLKGGQHLLYPQDTPLANLMFTILDRANVDLESFGDSTGLLSEV